jgi:hypothetical protein
MNNLLVSNPIDYAHGRLENRSGSSLVASQHSGTDFLDGGTQFGTLGHVLGTRCDSLTGTLASLDGIRHKSDS